MSLRTDLRHALRLMRRAPAATAITVLLVALGVGANTAVFVAVNAALVRALPYADPDRLVVVRENGPEEISRGMRVGLPDFFDWRERGRSFEDLAATTTMGLNLSYGAESERVQGQIASYNLARTLGVAPALGRFFTVEEEQPGVARVAVISHALWMRALGGRPDAIGSTISLNMNPATVVGVMPESFVTPEPADVWLPLGMLGGPVRQWRANHMLEIVGRVRPGLQPGAAQRELAAIASEIWATHPFMRGWAVDVAPLRDTILGPVRPALLALAVAVAGVMLLVCANVASLLLARAAARRQEIDVRLALGASTGRILRQLLTEGLVLAAAGGAAGVLAAWAGLDVIRSLASSHLPHFATLRLDAVVLAYALGVVLVTAVVMGLAPALQLLRAGATLRAGRGGDPGVGRRTLSHLVAAEVSVAVVLLVATVMLVGSFQRLLRVDPGYAAEEVLSLRVALPQATYATPRDQLDALGRLRDALAALPGVRAVGIASSVPFASAGERRANSLFVQSRHADSRTGVLREDNDPATISPADVRYVDAGFFPALGMRLVRGTLPRASSDAAGAPVAVINQAAAQRVFPGEDALGQRIAVGSDPQTWRTVVAVVEDVRNRGLSQPAVEEVYLSHEHFPLPVTNLVVRTSGRAETLVAAAMREADRILPGVPVHDVATMRARLEGSLGVQRLGAVVMRALGVIAFVLALMGLYGVTAYLVARRTREFGIRIAVGARPADVVSMVLGQALRVAGLGVAIGLPLALGAARVLSTQLRDVGPAHPLALPAVVVSMVAAATAAACVPAWRAARVDPMVALRSD